MLRHRQIARAYHEPVGILISGTGRPSDLNVCSVIDRPSRDTAENIKCTVIRLAGHKKEMIRILRGEANFARLSVFLKKSRLLRPF